jgi:16S rRNA (cytosine1402-N4)-methyltransferase
VNPAILHTPVLVSEVIEGLEIRPGGRYIDVTLGTGGHARAMLDASSPDGTLLGIDKDPAAIEVSRGVLTEYGNRATLVLDSFAQLAHIARTNGFVPADAVLLDLGLSSLQLASSERGFSFQSEGPLDMRMDPSSEITAERLVNELREEELSEIVARYGEEPRARAIAREIVRQRPVSTTTELARIVTRAAGRRGRIHPATRTFQALRIAVNRELDELSEVLPQTLDVLARGGKLAVITFHSLEDRIVKRFMIRESHDCICPPESPVCRCEHQKALEIVTKKPLRPSAAEISRNPRARSAKLRIATRVLSRGEPDEE